jgi:hypothetical protein
MSEIELKELTEFLLQRLKQGGALTPDELMATPAEQAPAAFSPAGVTRAVWRLVESGDAEFTSDWKLKVAA